MAAGSPVRDIRGISTVPTIKAAASSLARRGALVRTVMVCKTVGSSFRLAGSHAGVPYALPGGPVALIVTSRVLGWTVKVKPLLVPTERCRRRGQRPRHSLGR